MTTAAHMPEKPRSTAERVHGVRNEPRVRVRITTRPHTAERDPDHVNVFMVTSIGSPREVQCCNGVRLQAHKHQVHEVECYESELAALERLVEPEPELFAMALNQYRRKVRKWALEYTGAREESLGEDWREWPLSVRAVLNVHPFHPATEFRRLTDRDPGPLESVKVLGPAEGEAPSLPDEVLATRLARSMGKQPDTVTRDDLQALAKAIEALASAQKAKK